MPPEQPQNTQKRDLLLEIQAKSQKKWKDEKVFESDAPTDVVSTPENKFYGNFPYPYMNGLLHLGHAFSLSKLEFAAAYSRMQGKHTLFPFAFHCTGMPIKAAADKLNRECEKFGCPPQFPAPEDVAPKEEAPKAEDGKDPTKFKGKKTKAVAKSGTEVYQWNILKSSGIDEAELPKFRDSVHWLRFFPPIGKEDVNLMGCGVDWRRSFITTDLNPYYDSFVRWQLNTMYTQKKCVKDKRFSVYSAVDGQPCADHDRATGEGVLPQDYTLIKMEALELPGKLAALEGKKVYLCAATLRPETMIGQTNYWILPDGDYGAYQMIDDEVFIVAARAARNLSFQDKTEVFGEAVCLLELKGSDMIGLPVKSPTAIYERIYGLPMLTILMNKGTGIVTSVPSDAPDDYMAMQDLKNKEPMRKKFGVEDSWIMPFVPQEIINIPEFGNICAEKVCVDLKIQSQNDRAKLDEAKHRTYLKGFTEGVMIAGPYKGLPVKEAKPKLREEMVAAKQAVIYSEPEKPVMSRSGDECVVALTNQWYLTYGEEEWLAECRKCLSKMNCYSDETRKAFEQALGWLQQWAVSRSFGLGTKLPFDPEYVIESLSDSTIYMAYYTIAHILQEGDMYSDIPGAHPIDPKLMTHEVYDYIFLDKAKPANHGLDEAKLALMKREFNFWYPFDLRVSGKDLIQNHLSFSMYTHTAIFEEKHWPRGFRCNGHLMLNGEKMSKSTGNFKTLRQAIGEYSSDAMRIALADAGDGLEDANFVEKTADANILRLNKEMIWIEEVLAPSAGLREGPPSTFADRVFLAEMKMAVSVTEQFYNAFNFRDALKSCWFDLQGARDTYRFSCGAHGMNKGLVEYYVELQTLMMTPIAPHTMQHIWNVLLKREGNIVLEKFPTVDVTPEDSNLQNAGRHMQKMETPRKPKKGQPAEVAGKVASAVLFIKPQFDGWHKTCLDVLAAKFDSAARTFAPDTDAAVLTALSEDETAKANVQGGEKMLKKLAMPFVKFTKDKALSIGPHVLQERLPFDELAVFRENADLMKTALGLESLTAFLTTDAEAKAAPASVGMDAALPGNPARFLELEVKQDKAQVEASISELEKDPNVQKYLKLVEDLKKLQTS
eukprot:gene6329-7584_t